jgi:adenylosuccinate lyase
MPHKRNPVASENLTGISRVLRSHVEIALQNIVLWHERDISHSAAERLYLPDNLGLVVYSLRRLQQLLADLHIDRDAMRARVAAAPGMHSSYYLHQLLQRTTASREELYARIQALSFAALPGAADLGAQLELEFKVQLPRVGYAEMLAHYQTQYQAVKARVQPPAAEQQL